MSIPLQTLREYAKLYGEDEYERRFAAEDEVEEEESDYTEPLDEEAGDTFALLEIGDKVTTPEGPGEVVDIALHGADYGDGRVELEPPAITVKLEDGSEVVTCPCVLELDDDENTSLLHSEYERLWPPVDDLPGDAHQLIDDEKIEEKMKSERSRLDKRYMRAQKWATHVITAEGPLVPGTVLEELEGVDLGKGAVVVEVDTVGDEQTVKLYMPETEDTKTVKLPLDSTYRALDTPEKKPAKNTVYDEQVLESGEPEGAIRWVPDSYMPKNPNYPSNLTDVLWRPTYRQYPRYPGGTWAMTNEEAMQARGEGDFVQFSDDGSDYIGTVTEVQGETALVDIMGYRNEPNAKWTLKVMGMSGIPVSSLSIVDSASDMRRGEYMNRQADYGTAYDYETAAQDDPYYTEEDWMDFPQITERDVVEEDWDPDLQPSPERLYENPIALFDKEKSPKKMYDLASELWQEYQTYRHKTVPGVTWSHGNFPFEYYCFIFTQDHGMSLGDMNELWDYMEEIGFMTMRERRQWDDLLKEDELLYRLKLYRDGNY